VNRQTVNLAGYSSRFSLRNRLGRVAWGCVHALLFRLSPTPLFFWRNLLLRCFGAKIGRAAHVYPSAKVWAPWNLSMGEHSCLASDVDCYCVAPVELGAHATVSQYGYLCAATHDYEDPEHRLLPGPIRIGAGAWLGADVFVGPNVDIGEGAVVGARASVFKDLPAWTVCVGNPARPLKPRVLRQAGVRP
jgi:putative colanic acid biosynthesis acetyltransferase WcaF